MKVLLRSCFMHGQDEEKHILQNISKFRDSGLEYDQDTDTKLWTYIKDFVGKFQHPPDLVTIRSYFENTRQGEVVDRLEYLASVTPRTQGNFVAHLEQKADERRMRRVGEILSDASTVLTTGITRKEGRNEVMLKGPRDAIGYIIENSRDVIAPTTGQVLSGIVNADRDQFIEEVTRAREDPLAGRGQQTGIGQIDDHLPGSKRHELWIHAAFTGGMKSTFMVNWCYNQAVGLYGKEGQNPGESSLIFSLEMPYQQVRRILYVMHSRHPKFKDVFGNEFYGLDYQRVRDGTLDDNEMKALEYISTDFANPENKYGQVIVEVHDPDKSRFTVPDLRAKAEYAYSQNPFAMMVVDHVGLMHSVERYSSTTERLNEVIRDLKRLSMSFNRGMGMGTVALFQISREGFKAAEKNGGRYNLTHLSYANEAERSADIVTATWVDDELRQKNEVKFQCLKSRDDSPFQDFVAGVHWPQRRIYTKKNMTVDEVDAASNKLDEGLDIDSIIDGM